MHLNKKVDDTFEPMYRLHTYIDIPYIAIGNAMHMFIHWGSLSTEMHSTNVVVATYVL